MVIGSSIGAVGVLDLIMSKIVTSSFTSKKKKCYYEKVQIVKQYMNRVYIYIEKARNDGIITIKEIEDFRNILQNLDKELERKQGGDNIELNNLINEVKEEADKKYGITIKKDMKKKLMKEYKKKLKNGFESQLYQHQSNLNEQQLLNLGKPSRSSTKL